MKVIKYSGQTGMLIFSASQCCFKTKLVIISVVEIYIMSVLRGAKCKPDFVSIVSIFVSLNWIKSG